MKSSLFFTAVLLAAVSILLSIITDAQTKNVAVVTQEQQAAQFLNYVGALNDLYSSGTPADGDVTTRITLPAWQPHGNQIQLRISSGTGYAFTPSSPGLFAQLMQMTENSTHFGLSDATGINTPAGKLTRPGFLPSGYVVYVR
ncbi:type IV pilus biogenesis protein PilM [Rahnella perminowiae]|uniref:type IV pilus biogenesis protein PilM n=1 Tax=Rahnella perminowiae TaxID=2816244 RepID=UPI00215D0C46|nr:type IV pilus biogenesis protein PilM [Rahnella perminowiae]MCR8998652.1 type IV pilus biogenesis protein PilM [Rahnella perminowiae]MCR8998711.1 type IV pilus biogenesis protein PilM [Rahnella perminowiae]